ncbi:MAG: tyrosine-type recombinase/integrase [Microthrixaceae bacterium]
MAITRRETNSNGRAYADGKPRWQVRLRRPDGSQYSETFTTRKAAERWERNQLTSQGNGGWVDPAAGRALLADRAESFLTDRPRPLAPKTLELYRNLLDRFILPAFGDVPIGSITTEAVRAWLSRVRNDSSELQSAKAYRLLRAILNVAVSDAMIARNPCVISGAGQEHSGERPLATAEQIHQLAEAIRPHLRALVLLAAFGALRRGELFGLERRDLDVGAGQLSVQRQAIYLKDRTRKVTPPKSAAGVRTVSLPPFVVEALKERLATWTAPERNSPVFVGERGGPLGTVSLQACFDEARRATGPTQFTLHDLRHAGGTMAAWTGATTKELMARLGHSTHDAALRYQRAAQARDAEIAAKLDVFRPQVAANPRPSVGRRE